MWKIIKSNLQMLQYIKKYCPSHIILVSIDSILETASNLLSIFFTKYIIDSLVTKIDYMMILKMALIIFLLNLSISFVHIYINQYATPKNNLKLSKGMQNEIFNKCVEIDYKCYEDPKFYNDFTMAVQQSDNRAMSVLNTISGFISSMFGITSFSIVISVYDPILFILVLINVVVYFLFITLNTKVQHEFYEDMVLDSRKSGYAQRVFYLSIFAKEIRLFTGISEVIKSQYNIAMSNLMSITKKYTKIISNRLSIQVVISNSIHIINTLYIALKVLMGYIQISDFVTLTTSSLQLENQINTLLQVFPNLYEHYLYIDNFRKFIEYKSEKEVYNINYDFKLNMINDILIKNLSFCYPNCNIQKLININISIKKGEHIALVGRNGSGKSTLIKLISQLYLPSAGTIKINSININQYNEETLKNKISVLFQDYQIFSLSIIENVLMRKINDKLKDELIVKEALKKVGLYEKIMSLPENIYTNISYEYDSNGTFLSGGELQRLAIARLYVVNSDLIILDEPSSSLDPISENEIFNDILYNMRNKIIIFVTHRLSNVIHCDKIYYFENGNIIEYGNHNDLLKLNGEYAKMYRLQNMKL